MNKHYLLYPTLVLGSFVFGFVINPNSQTLEEIEQKNLTLVEKQEQLKQEKSKFQEEITSLKSSLAKKESERKTLNDALWEANTKLTTCQNSKEQLQQNLNQVQSNLNTCQNKVNSSTNFSSRSGQGYISGTCSDLRRLGLSNFRPGDPNYTSSRDRDGDGVACEN